MRTAAASASAQAHQALAQGQLQVQWSQEETKELIGIRAELERDSTVAKRGKTLWEAVSSRLSARGFSRTPDQCKCKWKNLLNRYKGKETSDPEEGRQCPFFDELHALFTEREKSMKRLLVESEVGSAQSKKRKTKSNAGHSSDEFSEEEEYENECDTDEETAGRSNPRKRKAERSAADNKFSRATASANRNDTGTGTIQEMLKEFFQQQQMMDMQWREMMERREYERQLFEQEWRQTMEKIERERLMVEQAWKEREEQRRLKEESRAERRDALLTALLNKLINEN